MPINYIPKTYNSDKSLVETIILYNPKHSRTSNDTLQLELYTFVDLYFNRFHEQLYAEWVCKNWN